MRRAGGGLSVGMLCSRFALPLLCLIAFVPVALPGAESIQRLWLSHRSPSPERVVINWQSSGEGESLVEHGPTEQLGRVQKAPATSQGRLHHEEITVEAGAPRWFYRVRTGGETSALASFKPLPARGDLRVVVVGDWGYSKATDFSALLAEDAHWVMTAGDNVASLHEKGAEGLEAFGALVDRLPQLFRSTLFMPVLGNHDRELTPRGPKPPAHAVYDVEATAYREFFALPGQEWCWQFDIPAFDVRFVALDLNHTQDHGTTWQTCHAWDAESAQFRWYHDLMSTPATRPGFVFTIMNEKQTALQGKMKGLWHEQFSRGSALITGFGYFAERAELKGGLPYFNTCLKGDGTPYKDPASKFFAREDNYLLLTFKQGAASMTVQFKNLRGVVLDSHIIQRRAP